MILKSSCSIQCILLSLLPMEWLYDVGDSD
jgi:hypothetical protein